MTRLLRNSTWALLAFGNAWLASAQTSSAAALYKTSGAFGLRITIELKRGSAVSMVNPQSEFRNGDQIRLHFMSNVDGYVYAMNETPSGDTKLLFPTAEAGSNNMVRKDQDYTIPSNSGWFRMTGAAGVERVLMIISPRALPEVEVGLQKTDRILAASTHGPAPVRPPVQRASDSGGATNSTAVAVPPPTAAAVADPADSGGAGESTSKPGVKNKGKSKGPMTTATQDVNQVRSGVSLVTGVASVPGSLRSIPGLGSRDLVFEDDLNKGSTYVSAKPEGLSGPTMFTIALVHR